MFNKPREDTVVQEEVQQQMTKPRVMPSKGEVFNKPREDAVDAHPEGPVQHGGPGGDHGGGGGEGERNHRPNQVQPFHARLD